MSNADDATFAANVQRILDTKATANNSTADIERAVSRKSADVAEIVRRTPVELNAPEPGYVPQAMIDAARAQHAAVLKAAAAEDERVRKERERAEAMKPDRLLARIAELEAELKARQ